MSLIVPEHMQRKRSPIQDTPKDVIYQKYPCYCKEKAPSESARDCWCYTGISTKIVINPLHEIFHIMELCAPWMPQLPIVYIKSAYESLSEQCLTMVNCSLPKFSRRLVHVDETCVHHRVHDSMPPPKLWTAVDESATKTARVLFVRWGRDRKSVV